MLYILDKNVSIRIVTKWSFLRYSIQKANVFFELSSANKPHVLILMTPLFGRTNKRPKVRVSASPL